MAANPIELTVERLENVIRQLGAAVQQSQCECARLRASNRKLRNIALMAILYAGAGTAGVIAGFMQ